MEIEYELLESDDIRGLASECIGPPTRPQDVPDMPLFAAVYWIASKGGAEDFDAEDQATWRSAAEALLKKVRFGLKVTGRRSERDDLPDPDGIRAEEFYGTLLIVPPYQSQQDFANAAFDDVPRLVLSRPSDDPRDGDDRLFSGDLRPTWFDLRVSGSDVARLWPFQEGLTAYDQPVITYVDALDRVGRAQFGNVWSQSLTDDERYNVEGGLWQASSASAYRSAEEKAKKIQWRRGWADAWLAENGLIDPVQRQFGLEIPPIPRKKFESAFFPVFGNSDNGVSLDLRGALECASGEQSAYAKAMEILATPWSPPKILTRDQVNSVIGDEPRPYLTDVVDLMAFGTALPDTIRDLLRLLAGQRDHDARTATCKALATEGYPVQRIVAERRRAGAALFEAVRRAVRPVLIGSRDRQADTDSIPPHYFDIPKNLGHQDNSISPDLDKLSNEQFSAEFENRSARWFNVRIDAQWFFSWLTHLLEPTPPRAAPKAAGANVKNWLVDLMKQSPMVRKNKDQLFEEARERFGADMSRRSFDKTYTNAIDQVPGCKWNAQGRTPVGNPDSGDDCPRDWDTLRKTPQP